MRAGEKVCIQAIRPTQALEEFASRQSWWIESPPVITGLQTTFNGI